MPDDLLLATVASIPKDKCGDICNSDNYRGIALSSALSKLNDIIILMKYPEQLSTSEMQFAYKPKHGTSMCSLALKEVVKYYIHNGSDVYTSFIDASKAFDRVRHDKLFLELIARGLPAIVIRSLYDSYKRQRLRTIWCGFKSECFETSNGIKQGSVISPVLFTIYMDVLLHRLEKSGNGCRIGLHYYGALSSADDLTMLCPSLHGLQIMMDICSEYGVEFGVKYNPTKSVNMHFSLSRHGPPERELLLAGESVKWVSHVKHLGNIIRSDLKECDDIARKRGDLIGRVNNLLVTFPKADDVILATIFNSKCSHLYGCEAWDLSDTSVVKFFTTWNRGVRKVFKLPFDTHTRFLSAFLDRQHVKEQVSRRFYKMVMTMRESKNTRLSFLTRKMMEDGRSIIGSNKHILMRTYGFNHGNVFLKSGFNQICSITHESDKRTIAMIKELRKVQRGTSHLAHFSMEEINDILYDLCAM